MFAPTAHVTAARHEREGVALCTITAVAFAANVVLAKLAYAAGATPVALLAPRFAIASAVLWLLAARRGVARVAPRDALAAFAIGLAIYSAETELMFASLARIAASLAELICFSYPAFVVLAAIALRREAPSRRRLGALALATAGVALVLGGGASGALDAVGIAMPLGAAVLSAGYVLTADALGGRLHPLALAALVSSGAGVAFVVGGAATGALHPAMPLAAWGWTAAIALGTTVLPMGAFLGGVARLGPSRASILAMLEPPLVLVGAFVVFGERLGALQLVGGALVLGAAVLVQLRPRRARRLPASGERYAPLARQRRAMRSNRSNARRRAPGDARAASRRSRDSSIR